MTDKFTEFLISRVPHYDQQILRDIRPPRVKIVPEWWKTRETVRKISEGIGFSDSRKAFRIIEDGWIGHVESGKFSSFTGVEHSFDRFHEVFPQLGTWKSL